MPYHVAKRSCMFRTTILFLVFLSAKLVLAQDTLTGSDKFALQFNGGLSVEMGRAVDISKASSFKASSFGESVFDTQIDLSASLHWKKFRLGVNAMVYTYSVLFDGNEDNFFLFGDIAYRVNKRDSKVLLSPFVCFGKRLGHARPFDGDALRSPLIGVGMGFDKFWNGFGLYSRVGFQYYTFTQLPPMYFNFGGINSLRTAVQTLVLRLGVSYKFGL